MTDMQRRPGERRRGSVDDLLAGGVRADGSDGSAVQLCRRRATSWRLPPLGDGRRDPWGPVHPDTWTDSELESWAAAAVHLRRSGLQPAVPDSVRMAWYRHRSCSCCGGVA